MDSIGSEVDDEINATAEVRAGYSDIFLLVFFFFFLFLFVTVVAKVTECFLNYQPLSVNLNTLVEP